MSDPSWLEQLKELICRIYREWGGDCSELPFAISVQIQTLWTTYHAEGAPTFCDVSDRVAYLQLLSATVVHLSLPGNNLSQADDLSLRTLIADIQNALSLSGP